MNIQKLLSVLGLLAAFNPWAEQAVAQANPANMAGEARGVYVPIPDVTSRREMTNLWNTYNVKWRDFSSEALSFVADPPQPSPRRSDDVLACHGGELNQAWRELIVRQANVYRAIAGLDGIMLADNSANVAAQASALIQHRYWLTTRKPSNSPLPGDACYTSLGANIAAISHVGIGVRAGSIWPIGYIDSTNMPHVARGRANFLNPQLTGFAVGDIYAPIDPKDTTRYSASTMTPLYARAVANTPEAVFYPPRNSVIPVEWYPTSAGVFTMMCPGGCDYSKAVVSATYQGQPTGVTTTIADNQLVFSIPAANFFTRDFSGLDTSIRRPKSDEVVEISIGNVLFGGVAKNYTYKVTVFDAYAELMNNIYPASYYGGLWNNDRNGEAGWGLNLAQSTSGNLFGTWYTYDANGKPLWLVWPGCTWSSPTRCTGALYSTAGTPYTKSYKNSEFSVTAIGSLTVNFTSNKVAQMSWSLNDGTAMSRPLTRFENVPESYRDGANYSGLWNADLNTGSAYETGWGVSISQDFSTMFGVWYAYGDDGKPLWILMPGGAWTGPSTYEGTLYTTTGTGFNKSWIPSLFAINAVGQAKLDFASQDDATFTLNVNGTVTTKKVKRFVRY